MLDQIDRDADVMATTALGLAAAGASAVRPATRACCALPCSSQAKLSRFDARFSKPDRRMLP
jgi:hypothetical protein